MPDDLELENEIGAAKSDVDSIGDSPSVSEKAISEIEKLLEEVVDPEQKKQLEDLFKKAQKARDNKTQEVADTKNQEVADNNLNNTDSKKKPEPIKGEATKENNTKEQSNNSFVELVENARNQKDPEAKRDMIGKIVDSLRDRLEKSQPNLQQSTTKHPTLAKAPEQQTPASRSR